MLNADVAVGLVLAYPSVAELAEALDAGQGMGPREAPAERLERLLAGVREDDQVGGLIAALSADARPARTAAVRHDGHILITGVTGFFGAFLLDELLTQTDAHISCLVRAGDEDHAQARVQASLERFGRWSADAAARISPVPGDLTRPMLGLRQSRFNELAKTVDSDLTDAHGIHVVVNRCPLRQRTGTSRPKE